MSHDPRDLPAIYALALVQTASDLGVEPGRLLEGLGIEESDLADPGRRVSIPTFEELHDRARDLTGEPGIAVPLGIRLRLSTHGFLGFAAMTAATIGEALDVGVRYASTRTDAVSIALDREGDRAAVRLVERVPLGGFREPLTMALLVGIAKIARDIAGLDANPQVQVDFAFPPPDYLLRIPVLADLPLEQLDVRFDQPASRIVFAAELLETPISTSDPAATQLAREQCERELEEIGLRARFVVAVRDAVRTETGFRSSEEVASALNVSLRTLKRRLREHGTSFREVVDELRLAEADRLLARPGLSIEQIAERLGYSDAANFGRAYRRWTGKTPGAVRSSD